jgi:hypothetical protein
MPYMIRNPRSRTLTAIADLFVGLVALCLILTAAPARGDGEAAARWAMYMGEAADCGNTAVALQVPGAYETNPLLAPFTKAGHTILERAAFTCGAYAVYDILAGMALRGSPAHTKSSFYLSQFGDNVYGVEFTIYHTHR